MAIHVQTTQNVEIEYEAAGLGLRVVGYLVDLGIIILWTILFISCFIAVTENNFDRIDELSWAVVCFYAIPVIFYDLIFECFFNGQSPAKKMLKIRVVNVDGTRPSIGSYVIRWLFRLVDFPLSNYVVGLVMVLATDKSQRLGDTVAGTTVINLRASKRNNNLVLPNLDFQDDYVVTYPDLLDRLTDKDIRTIRTSLETKEYRNDAFLHKRLCQRITQVTGYVCSGDAIVFLQKIVDDYTFLALRR